MDRYIDDTYSILDGTLLICRSTETDLVIPAEVNGHPIRRIGNGCSAGEKTETIVIREGIKEIGADAFTGERGYLRIEYPASLEKMEKFSVNRNKGISPEIILWRRLSSMGKERLVQNSIRLQDGRCLLAGDYASWPEFSGILKGFVPLSPPARLDADMGRLYVLGKEQCEQLVFEGGGEPVGNKKFVRRRDISGDGIPILLKYQKKEFWDNASELESDKAWQVNRDDTENCVVLCFYQPDEMQQKGSDWLVRFQIGLERVFFPSVVKIVCDGKPVYIYREMFLSGAASRPFVREDYENCVFDAQGNIRRDDKTYARYKLLAMLT